MCKQLLTTSLQTKMRPKDTNTLLSIKFKVQIYRKLLLLLVVLVWKKEVNNLVIKLKFLSHQAKFRVRYLLFQQLEDLTIIDGDTFYSTLLCQKYLSSLWEVKIYNKHSQLLILWQRKSLRQSKSLTIIFYSKQLRKYLSAGLNLLNRTNFQLKLYQKLIKLLLKFKV